MILTSNMKFDDIVKSANCDEIVIFPIYGQSGAIQKPDSGRIVGKTYMSSLEATFHLTRTENKIKKSLLQLSYYCFE